MTRLRIGCIGLQTSLYVTRGKPYGNARGCYRGKTCNGAIASSETVVSQKEMNSMRGGKRIANALLRYEAL
jgi:hypothetical protein